MASVHKALGPSLHHMLVYMVYTEVKKPSLHHVPGVHKGIRVPCIDVHKGLGMVPLPCASVHKGMETAPMPYGSVNRVWTS